MWETHKCCECDREHDASLWYRIEDYGFPKYLCGEKYNELPPENRSEWRQYHPADPE